MEVEKKDFQKICKKLVEKLALMGVKTYQKNIMNAPVSVIHYSKNILLEKGVFVSMILKEINRVNINNRLDLNKVKFRNDGHSLSFHANSYEIVFYDKIKDMEQSKISSKRGIEKDNHLQQDLMYRPVDKDYMGVLRMEIRFVKKTKIKEVLKKLDYKGDMTFHSLFNREISQKILKYYWDQVIADMDLLFLSSKTPENIFEDIVENNKMKLDKVLKILGCTYLIDSLGFKGFKSLVQSHTSIRTGQRIARELKGIKQGKNNIRCSIINNIDKALKDYETVSLNDYMRLYF